MTAGAPIDKAGFTSPLRGEGAQAPRFRFKDKK